MESFTSAPSSEQRPYMREEEYLWSYKFSGAGKEYSWCLEDRADQDEEDAADPSVKPGHRLLLKFAVLMHRAKAGEESAGERATTTARYDFVLYWRETKPK